MWLYYYLETTKYKWRKQWLEVQTNDFLTASKNFSIIAPNVWWENWIFLVFCSSVKDNKWWITLVHINFPRIFHALHILNVRQLFVVSYFKVNKINICSNKINVWSSRRSVSLFFPNVGPLCRWQVLQMHNLILIIPSFVVIN
jgi:hypothetical protein